MLHMRSPFAPEFNFVVKHPFTFAGRHYEPGEEFDKTNVEARLLKMLHEQHKLDSVIPSIVIAEKPSKPVMAAKAAKAGKGAPRKDEAPSATPAAEAAPAAPARALKLANNFNKVQIMDGETVVRECANREEAIAAMKELGGG